VFLIAAVMALFLSQSEARRPNLWATLGRGGACGAGWRAVSSSDSDPEDGRCVDEAENGSWAWLLRSSSSPTSMTKMSALFGVLASIKDGCGIND
jgi:hypothetical protein